MSFSYYTITFAPVGKQRFASRGIVVSTQGVN